MYKGIIFDFDGTLLDTLCDLANSVNAALRVFGFPVHDTEKYKYFVGNGAVALIERALPEDKQGDKELLQRVFEQYQCEYRKHYTDTTAPYEGIPELIENLRRAGIKLAVLSNKPHEFTVSLADRIFGSDCFCKVLGVSEDVPRKPDPKGADMICAVLGLKKEEILYVGDTNTDMQTAKAASLDSCGVLWGFRTEKELCESGASYIARVPADIEKIVKGEK